MRFFIDIFPSTKTARFFAAKGPASQRAFHPRRVKVRRAAARGQAISPGCSPVARLPALNDLVHRLVATILLIGRTNAAHTEMARLGLACPESRPTRPQGSPIP